MRRRVNRAAARVVDAALEAVPGLRPFVASRVDDRRLELALTRLQREGTTIGTVYDIGAHCGDWTRSIRPALPDATFVLFEGNRTHEEALRHLAAHVVIDVLADEERDVAWVATGEPGDSYRRELTPEYSEAASTRVRATTLDAVVARDALAPPDLIKADVQGAELDVLAGGRRALEHASAVLLECPILPYNEGAPTIDAYFAFMDDAGFTVDDVVHAHRREGRTFHADVLFVRVGS
jgi:FkbM family methyltransferase